MTYKRNKNLKELISPSLFPKTIKKNNCSFGKCSRRCDICKNFLVVSTDYTCHATKHKYKTRGTLTCNTKNIIYLITCQRCIRQCIGYAAGFRERFGIYKSDVNIGKRRCGVANHLINVCKSAICKMEYLQVQLIEHAVAREGEDIDKIFWESVKYCQVQLFTLTYGLSSNSECYAIIRRGYRK